MISIAEKMVAGGSCIAKIDGKVVFIPYALPGETVDITVTESRKDYSFAKIVSIVEPSPHRRTPPCPYFGRCGGCTLQMADDDFQVELRLSILRDVLSRARVTPELDIHVVTGEPFGYRSRFQFHRTKDGKIGLKEGESAAIIPVTDCSVAVEVLRDRLGDGSLARDALKRNSGDRFHVFAYNGNLWQEDVDTDCQVTISGKTLKFDVRGFFQSNVPMLEKMIAAVCLDLPEGERLLDFYSGVGTFSRFAGEKFRETVLVEHNREALAVATENLAGSAVSPLICAVSDENWPKSRAARLRYDVCIVDPPRQGIGKKALEWFMAQAIPEIRYVSCDPVTFARDAAKLVSAGYRLKEVTMFDFYPQTHHLETFGVFAR